MQPADLEVLARKLDHVGSFSEAERRVLETLPNRTVRLGAQHAVVRERDEPRQAAILLEGLAIASKAIAGGRRQITGIYLPGDMPDLQSLHLQVLDVTITTLVPSRIAFVGHAPLLALCTDHPRIGFALWRSTLLEAATYREWIANTGQRRGLPRMAHLICETVTRLRDRGLMEEHSAQFPLTQVDLGDALGLSPVHVNRILQELRRSEVIQLKGSYLRIVKWDQLCRLAGFDDSYLHLGMTKRLITADA